MSVSESTKLALSEVRSNADYQSRRKEFRGQALEYRRLRTQNLGPHLALSFENRHTVRYQLQEMLLAEKIEAPRSVAAALAACNALIPGGSEWKAACHAVVPPRGKARAQALEAVRGAGKSIWLQVAELPRIAAVDDDPDAEAEVVHLLSFPLDPLRLAVLRAGGPVRIGVDHEGYRHEAVVPEEMRQSLLTDLAGGTH